MAVLILVETTFSQAKKDGTHPLPLMRTPTSTSPWQSFQHLRRGNVVCQHTDPQKRVVARPRPYGPGRRIAAIAAPVGLRRSAAELFAVANDDLLVFASPGPLVRQEEVEALERAVQKEHVALLVILVDPDDPFFRSKSPHLALRRKAAEQFSKQEKIDVPSAHGILQAETIWRSSDLLGKRHRQGRFQVAVGLLRSKTGAIEWVSKWHKRWQLVSSASVKEAMKLKEAQAQRREAERRKAADSAKNAKGAAAHGEPKKHHHP